MALVGVGGMLFCCFNPICEVITWKTYHVLRQPLAVFLGVKLMEISSNLFGSFNIGIFLFFLGGKKWDVGRFFRVFSHHQSPTKISRD